jgi:hypothetical protein
MESAEAPVTTTTVHSGGRLQLALVFLLSMALSLFSYIPFVAIALVYGPAVVQNVTQTDSSYLTLLRVPLAFAFVLIFYQLGKRVDFRGQYLKLAILSFAGVLVGALPQLVEVQTTSTTSFVVTGSTLVGVGLGNSISVLSGAFQEFAFPFAGLALPFLREGYLRPSLWPSAATGDRRLLSPPVLALGFAIATMAYLASALTDVIGSSLPQPGQFAFLRIALVIFPPYDSYAYEFFYPLLFFIVFYFLGKRLDNRGGGVVAFATSMFAAGAIGFLVGVPMAYYIRAFAASSANHFPSFSFEPSFLVDSVGQGLYVLVFGFAAASLGFIRNMENPINHDRLVAAVLVAVVFVLFALSVFLGVSPGTMGTVTIITTVSTTTAPLPT